MNRYVLLFLLLMIAVPQLVKHFATPEQEWTRFMPGYAQFDDQGRDGRADFQDAIRDASDNGKQVMMILGGHWCHWCRSLNSTFNENPELARKLAARYVVLHMYVGDGGRNDEFLTRLPRAPGVPWIYVFDGQGRLVRQIDSNEMVGNSGSYDPQRIEAVL